MSEMKNACVIVCVCGGSGLSLVTGDGEVSVR